MPKPDFTTTATEISQMIRVNHAGEYGAVRIYAGQLKYTNGSQDAKIIESMLLSEQKHFDYFSEQITKHKVRPTLLMPIWHCGGYIIGAISALASTKSAMLVTEAVEEVIDNHYATQINKLKIKNSNDDLLSAIKKFRLEELEHMNIAGTYRNKHNIGLVESTFSGIIKVMCKTAIYLSTKI